MKLNINNHLLKCLISVEHVFLNKKLGEIEDKIKIEYDDESLEIKLDEKERFFKGFNKGFNNENYKNPEKMDIALIEIKNNDNIKDKYFLTEYTNKEESLENKNIHIVQYPGGRELSESKGNIREIKTEYLFSHTSSTEDGSSGSPIFLENTDKIIGIHKAGNKNEKINYGFFIFPIIPCLEKNKILIEKFKQDLKDEHNSTEIFSKTEITFKYKRDGLSENSFKLFGKKFLENYKDKLELFINNKK